MTQDQDNNGDQQQAGKPSGQGAYSVFYSLSSEDKAEVMKAAYNLAAYNLGRKSLTVQNSYKILKADREKQESWIELIEEYIGLEKRSRKFRPKDPTEPRITYWLSAPIAYMLSEEQREEWLGDLQEVNREMMRKGYPEWMISIVNVGQIIRLIVSSLDIKIVDLILKLRGKA
uniref:hypothetical protein n=1 Tax=Trichocoleus desertorum TaxID=1481672 RepID=UPI0025B50333|nr:hypothetical protein [Trichocoleus desertorum]